MTKSHVTPAEIAHAARRTEKHVRRMISRARGGGPFVSPYWFGVRMRILDGSDGPKVEFASLPEHIREAFVMLDQPELPLRPPMGAN